VIVTLLILSALVAVAPQAHADWTTYLPGFVDIAVDNGGQRLFVSTASSVDVLDFDGSVLTTIPSSGAAGLVLAGSTLYVARAGTTQIDKINTSAAPPAKTGSIDTGITLSGWLGRAGGKLWFGQDPSCNSTGIYSVVPSTGVVEAFTGPDFPSVCPAFVSSPTDPTRLFVWTPLVHGYPLLAYDVSTKTPTKLATEDSQYAYGDVAVSPDGQRVLVGGGSSASELKSSDLTSTGTTYPIPVGSGGGSFAVAVAYTGNGGHVAVEGEGATAVYAAGNSTPINTIDTSRTCAVSYNVGGLAFEVDDSRLFIGGLAVREVDHPTQALTAYQLAFDASAAQVAPGMPISLTGSLTDGGTPVPNTRIDIYLDATLLSSVTTGPDGSFSAQDVHSDKRFYCYEARYLGDQTHLGLVRGGVFVQVTSFSSSLTLQVKQKTVFPKDPVTVSGQLQFSGGGPVVGKHVSVFRSDCGPRVLIASPAVDAEGDYSVTDRPAAVGFCAYDAKWAGDVAHDAAASQTDGATVRKLATSLSLQTSAQNIEYRKFVMLTAHLARHFNRNVVTIWIKAVGDAWKVLKEQAVDASGDVSVRLAPQVNAMFRATWPGDLHYDSTHSATRGVVVHALASERLVDYDGTSGQYRLYRYTTRCGQAAHQGCPNVLMAVVPNHAGRRILYFLQGHVHGSWQTVLEGNLRLPSTSSARLIIFYTSAGIIGVPLRIRMQFPPDTDHGGDTTPYAYFKVVGQASSRLQAGRIRESVGSRPAVRRADLSLASQRTRGSW
jgi:hypothetical protein